MAIRRQLQSCLLWVLGLVFAGCASTMRPELYLSHFDLKQPEIGDFEACVSAGCKETAHIGYTIAEWERLVAFFEPPAQTAAGEREQIREAIGLTERINGPKKGTEGDAPRNRRSEGSGAQLDCIAEAANTTVALLLFQKEGLLRFHRVGYPQHRGFLQLRMPHNAASIYETETDAHYVVDSWFFENGVPPVCVPVGVWRAGYDPEE